jgi:parallel beta-helix repeat protein/predicted outer membrane repeat protein
MCRKARFTQGAWTIMAFAAPLAVPGLLSSAMAGTVYVAKTGNDANDGLTWATAKRTVQAGLNASVANDQVRVAAGTYVENITLKLEVALYGGFVGNETDLSQRNWATNKTILDGNQAGSVVTSPSGATLTTRIDGFTIRNGTGTRLGSYRYGGGMYCQTSSPTVVNNTLTGNAASDSSSDGFGGGIYCDSSSPTIANNMIVGNTATRGGGLYCTNKSSPAITSNTIAGNSAIGASSYAGGGGVYCYDSSAMIANNMISSNSATNNGGGIYSNSSSLMIANNTITGNAALCGGGIYCSSSSPTIANTIIAFNSSGVYNTGGSPTLRYNCVFGNTASNYSGLTDPTGTNGNISADPMLGGVAYGNVHIQPGSPCVDAGDDSVVQSGSLDMDGQARIQGAHVDIGADESDGTLCPEGPYVIVRVSPDGDDANDGSSWVAAKRTVQAAVDAASALGGEVWVKAGIYPERITLRLFAHVHGGFSGTEETRGQRDFRSNVTILDGQKAGSVVTVPAGYRVSTIDGLTIRNGNAVEGGGICCAGSSPMIANDTIIGNTASSGGGIYCAPSSSAMIANNTITGNTAATGGGICCSSSSPTIANNTVSSNAASQGGGIYCYSRSPTITNTIVAFNSSGIFISGSPVLRHNCVYGNAAYDYSGITDPRGTNGNISADPKLADVAYGNLHIQADSPCVDAGDDAAVQPGWLDIDGQGRVQGNHMDIGADESDGTAWPAGPYVTVRVSPDGNDANDGSSWAAPKRTVQAGINAAASLGGEVWVQAGTYYERITLLPFANIYGGFAGTEGTRVSRDWVANVTILDGQQGGPVVTARGVGYGFSTVDGFTITNGRTVNYGGGIYCSLSSPTIANNTIRGNTTAWGGAICCLNFSCPTSVNNAITGNNASSCGGGIYCQDSSPTIANNTITGNIASDSGGGIYCNFASPAIVNTIIAFNSSGIYGEVTRTSSFRHNCVYGNTAFDYNGLEDPTGTNGNISADPMLAGFAYGNGKMHIQPDSPCADAGDDAVVQPGGLDIDGQPRVIGAHVDIGADESDGTLWPEGPYVIVRVSSNGDDASDGSSWAAAKRTVQAGVDVASALGGEVWVKAGTYAERITLRAFAHVYGGFSGAEEARSQRDFRSNVTILDGQQGGSTVIVRAGHRVSTIDGFTIRNGRAPYGGGIYCLFSSPTISNNTISGNYALSHGGGIYCEGSFSPIANNTISGNSGSYYGGGIYCFGGYSMIANNVIAGNSASRGGGVYCDASSPVIANDTISRNVASVGGGIYCSFSSATIANTIIAFNSSGVYKIGLGPPLRYNCVYGNTAYNYSGIADPTGTSGNISLDPLFTGVADLCLQAGSPCIDAGSNAVVPADTLDLDADGNTTEPIPFDLGGRNRFADDPARVDTGAGTPPIVDIGAWERTVSLAPGLHPDFDGDQDVDQADFGHLQACFSDNGVTTPGCGNANLNGDGVVNLEDVSVLLGCLSGPGVLADPRCLP